MDYVFHMDPVVCSSGALLSGLQALQSSFEEVTMGGTATLKTTTGEVVGKVPFIFKDGCAEVEVVIEATGLLGSALLEDSNGVFLGSWDLKDHAQYLIEGDVITFALALTVN